MPSWHQKIKLRPPPSHLLRCHLTVRGPQFLPLDFSACQGPIDQWWDTVLCETREPEAPIPCLPQQIISYDLCLVPLRYLGMSVHVGRTTTLWAGENAVLPCWSWWLGQPSAMVGTWDPNPCCDGEQHTNDWISEGVFKVPAWMVRTWMAEWRNYREFEGKKKKYRSRIGCYR